MKRHKTGKGKQRDKQLLDDVAQHSAAIFSCATKTADEFAGVCDRHLEELELDLPYLRLALEIWAEHPDLAQPLRSALEELLQALASQHQILKNINQRLQRLATDSAPHIHLDPLDRYRQLARERLFSAPPPS